MNSILRFLYLGVSFQKQKEKSPEKKATGFISLEVSPAPAEVPVLLRLEFPGRRILTFYSEPRVEFIKSLLV